MDARQTVLNFFESRDIILGETLEEKLACRYLEEGLVDSIGVVEMINDIEQSLGVRFNAVQMQSEEFTSVGGLIQLIENIAS